MPRVQLQFHAEPEEVTSLSLHWARAHDLVAVFERFFPDYAAAVSDEASDGDPVHRISLCRSAPDLSAGSAHEFTQLNNDCLYVSIGQRVDDGLRESAVGGDTNDAETLRAWRSVLRDARSIMHAGAIARNPGTDATQEMPRHLYTDGAHKLAESGVKMLAAAGWVEFHFLGSGTPDAQGPEGAESR